MLDQRIVDFLKTKEGKRIFRDLTPDLDKRKRDNLKRKLVEPPENVKEWLFWAGKVENSFKKQKKV